MDERYIVSRIAANVVAIWDQVREDFHTGPLDCIHEARRLAFVLNSRAHAQCNTSEHETVT